MGNKINYTLIGLFFVLVVSALGIAAWWLGGYGKKADDYRSYFIKTTSLPSGIKKDSAVKFIGVDAGSVKDIRFADEKEALIELELSVRKDIPIRTDSTASAEIQGITGIGYLNISRGSMDSPLFDKNEKAYIGLEAGFFDKIGDRAEYITQNLESTFKNINKFLSDENAAKFSSILVSVDEAMKKINAGNLDMNATIANANEVLVNANLTLNELKKALKNASSTLEFINSFTTKAADAAQELKNLQTAISEKIKSGEYDVKDALNTLSDETERTLLSFQKLISDFRNTLFRLEDDPYEFFFKDTQKKDEK